MILSIMDDREIVSNIKDDYRLICSRYDERISKEYDKIRRRNKIDIKSEFPYWFEIKTPSKNNWLLSLCKGLAISSYKGLDSVTSLYLCYYYHDTEIKVFQVNPFNDYIFEFDSKFFKRYNEEMNLNITESIDIVKHYFMHNGRSVCQFGSDGEKKYVRGLIKEGFILGDILIDKSLINFDTFIRKDKSNDLHNEIGNSQINELRDKIENHLNKKDIDTYELFGLTEIFKTLVA